MTDVSAEPYGSAVIDLLPGIDYQSATGLLADAQRDVLNLMGRSLVGVEFLNEYRALAARQGRALAGCMTSESVSSLVLTPGYARLLQMDPRAYGNGVAEVVSLEVSSLQPALEEARKSLESRALEWRDWRTGLAGKAHSGVVLDTNVMLHHADRLDRVDWRSALQLFPDEQVTLVIPIAAVEELDRLKTAGNPMEVDGTSVPIRTRVRIALAHLDQ